MIEQALLQHLQTQDILRPYLATYDNKMAIFSQEAPADKDSLWGKGSQYGRIVFSEDLQGDPERTMGGMLTVDILCDGKKQYPEDIEPVLRSLIHGYFFSSGTFVVAAQWRNSSYFTEPPNKVTGCTVSFELLAFPVITTSDPDLVARFNAWSAGIENLHVINYDVLPAAAWKPTGEESAIYWRFVSEAPAGWIPDNFHTIWRTAIVKGHIFSETPAVATNVARDIIIRLYADKRLLKPGDAPIMVNRRNTIDNSANPLRTGQVTVEATYGVIVYRKTDETINNINIPKGDL